MRIFIIVLVILAAAAGGYTLYWHKTADNIRTGTIQIIDNLNAQAKPLTKDLQLVRYDSVAVTGFPFSMVVEISKPVIDLPVSAFLSGMAKNAAAPIPFEWVEEINYGDKLLITSNITGDTFTSRILGDAAEKTLVNRAMRHSVTAGYSASPECSMQVASRNVLWSGQPLPTTLSGLLAVFRSFDCNTPAYTTKDATSGAPLFTTGGGAFSATSAPDGDINRKLSLKFDARKLVSTPAFDTITQDYMLMIYTLLGKPQEAGGGFPTSEFGEQNVSLDLGYDGPLDLDHLTAPGLNLHFDVNSFSIVNALENLAGEMHVGYSPQAASRAFSLSLHGTSLVTARYDEINSKRFTALLTQMAKSQDTDPNARFLQKLAQAGDPADTVAKLYPQSHLFGKTSIDIDLNAKGPNQLMSFLKEGHLTIDSLDWISALYGVKFKGKANAGNAQQPPMADFTLNCINCDAMIVDLGDYATRVESVLQKVSPGEHPPMMSKGLVDGFRLFLHGIADNGSARDLDIHFSMQNTGITVGRKQLPELLQLYMTDIAPWLPHKSEQPGYQ